MVPKIVDSAKRVMVKQIQNTSGMGLEPGAAGLRTEPAPRTPRAIGVSSPSVFFQCQTHRPLYNGSDGDVCSDHRS